MVLLLFDSNVHMTTSFHCTPSPSELPETHPATLHVSRLRALTILELKSFVLVARPLPENAFRVALRHDFCAETGVSVPCGEEKGENSSSPMGLRYSYTNYTDWWGDRQTLLCVSYKGWWRSGMLSALKKSKIHGNTS